MNLKRIPRLPLTFTALALVPVVAAGCFLLPRTDPVRYADTVIENICHITYDCCLPSERLEGVGFLAIALGGASRENCLEQSRESFGGVFNVVREAIANGTAEYDAELAERCTKDAQLAIDACELERFAVAGTGGGLSGRLDLNSLFFGIDAKNNECLAAAGRSFTRGLVKDGDDCVNNVECADFGLCVFENSDGPFRSATGTCTSPADKGESCEERDCQLGLVCNGETCEEQELIDNGDPCSFDSACESGFCPEPVGTCSDDGAECTNDFDCDFLLGSCINNLCNGVLGLACVEDFECDDVDQICDAPPQVCADAPTITVEICDGI